MQRRIISVLLTAALLLTMVPCGVFAAEIHSDPYPGPEDIWYDENPVEMSMEEYLEQQASGQSIAASTTASYSTDYPNTHVNTGNQAYDICCAALTQVGYAETPDNHTKYTVWLFGADLAYAWCGIFVSWAAGQADVSTDVIIRQGIASGYSTGNMSQNPYGCPAYAFGATEAKIGDIAFIGPGSSNHVGIVIGTSASYIWCVEGNASDTVALRRYDISSGYQSYGGGYTGSTRILFYARPNYTGSDIAVSGITVDDDGNVTYDSDVDPETDPDPEPAPSYDYCKFTDVPGDAYYSKAVRWAAENGYAYGMTDTTFEPYRQCTRAQIITFLWRLAGSPEQSVYDYWTYYYRITDVDYGTWYCNAVVWAVKNGIASGMTQYTFEPEGTCTRAQAVTFLYRMIGSLGYSDTAAEGNAFADVEAGAWYYNAVLWAAEQGIAYGMTSNSFEPYGNCTRGQIVTFMYRTYLKYQENF